MFHSAVNECFSHLHPDPLTHSNNIIINTSAHIVQFCKTLQKNTHTHKTEVHQQHFTSTIPLPKLDHLFYSLIKAW